jgi:hypothetical protein
MIAATKPSPMVSVFAGKVCISFMLDRGRGGFEAFDINECTVGTFASQRQAADAICERQSARQQ